MQRWPNPMNSGDSGTVVLLLSSPSFIMEEDIYTYQAELPASAQEDVLQFYRNSRGTPGSSGSQASMRICSRKAYTLVLGSILHDLHSFVLDVGISAAYDDATRIKKSCPTSMVTGDQAHSQHQFVGEDKGDEPEQ
ncbi:hypothetical protein E2C01_037522 [Portunus trituberculatus]|uniref:Uncharacterized protein n=1 Tax=Portunus trituberculatus TaxID=210409 RepID=A0A5B7FF60_PORTR|nr:hypothetical protein [Portunus trituberculatus]